MLYPIIIIISMAIIAVMNILFNDMEPWYIYVIYTTVLTILVILVDGFVAWIIRSMPSKYFDYHKKVFTTSDKEKKFFKVIGVKKWKEKVPELGMFTHFRKNKIADPNNPEYLERYILEACYGIIIHYVSVPTSFIIMLFDYKMYTGESIMFLTIALPVALVNAVLILLPAFILKNNLPKLVRLYEFKKRKSVEGDKNNETC